MNARAATQPSWPADREPTADEWVAWFLENDRAGRKEIAALAIGAYRDINRCKSAPGSTCWIDR